MLIRLVSGLVAASIWIAACFAGLLPFTVGLTGVVAIAIYELLSAYTRALAAAGEPAKSSRTGESGNTAIDMPSRQGDTASGAPVGNAVLAWTGVLLPPLAYLVVTRMPQVADALDNLLAILVGVYAVTVSRAGKSGVALGSARYAYGLLGLAYVGALFSGLVLLRGVPGKIVVRPFGVGDRGAWLAVYVPACAWMTDTWAYLVGRAMGRHKLAPTLSPNKTVEGSAGGFVGAAVTGAAVGVWIGVPVIHGLAVGAIAGLVGQVGDLFKSSLKREIHIKDFGSVMPGHGGALDRFDSVLFVVPLAYLYLRVVAQY